MGCIQVHMRICILYGLHVGMSTGRGGLLPRCLIRLLLALFAYCEIKSSIMFMKFTID